MYNQIFEIEVYPAYRGDCILIRCQTKEKATNILVDTGFSSTFEVLKKRIMSNEYPKVEKIDLMVITHIDDDHIAGAFNFLEQNGSSDNPQIIAINNIWHNSYRHLFDVNIEPIKFSPEQLKIIETVKSDVFKNDTFKNEFSGKLISPKQGSSIGELLLKSGYNWNIQSNGKAISIENCPVKIPISENVSIRILSPNSNKLLKLKKEWIKELIACGIVNKEDAEKYVDDAFEFFKLKNKEILKKHGFKISPDYKKIYEYLNEYSEIKEDDTEANGSSIAFILEFADKKALFLGDAHPSLIAEQIYKIYNYKPVKFDFIKVSHHGSKNNMLFKIQEEVFNLTDFIVADKYLLSTNGKKHNHPDCYTLSKIVTTNTDIFKQLYFNYETSSSKCFARNQEWKDNYNYDTEYIDYKTPIKL